MRPSRFFVAGFSELGKTVRGEVDDYKEQVQFNSTIALNLFKKSACLCEQFEECTLDLGKAMKYLEQAGELGSPLAKCLLRSEYTEMLYTCLANAQRDNDAAVTKELHEFLTKTFDSGWSIATVLMRLTDRDLLADAAVKNVLQKLDEFSEKAGIALTEKVKESYVF
jgi:hypothetical protein